MGQWFVAALVVILHGLVLVFWLATESKTAPALIATAPVYGALVVATPSQKPSENAPQTEVPAEPLLPEKAALVETVIPETQSIAEPGTAQKPEPRPDPKPEPEPESQPDKVAVKQLPEPEEVPATQPKREPARTLSPPMAAADGSRSSEPEQGQAEAQQAAADSGPTVVPPRVDARANANPPPAYPYRSRRFGEEGTVLLAIRISDTGNVETVSVKESSGHRRLDRAALKAVKGWRYQPATRAGKPIAYDYVQPVVFKLAD